MKKCIDCDKSFCQDNYCLEELLFCVKYRLPRTFNSLCIEVI